LFVIAVVAVVLLVTSHPQTALLVAVAGAVYGGVEGILTWRRRHSDS
jgi:arginine exporter protein ArgO